LTHSPGYRAGMVGFVTEGNEENKDCSLGGTKWILRCLPFLLFEKIPTFSA
jgi:hypothetical protein